MLYITHKLFLLKSCFISPTNYSPKIMLDISHKIFPKKVSSCLPLVYGNILRGDLPSVSDWLSSMTLPSILLFSKRFWGKLKIQCVFFPLFWAFYFGFLQNCWIFSSKIIPWKLLDFQFKFFSYKCCFLVQKVSPQKLLDFWFKNYPLKIAGFLVKKLSSKNCWIFNTKNFPLKYAYFLVQIIFPLVVPQCLGGHGGGTDFRNFCQN